jgi:hypothetical protein
VAALAPAYRPRRPTETVLYGIVRQHLESFLAYTREHYDGVLPRYVEDELRDYLKCGVFSEGFVRARCDACGHDLLVAFTCKSRTTCPSCAGRRMANTAAAIVDRVLPDVPVRQYVLSLPFELRKLAAFKADVLTALGRIFVETIFASYRARARRDGVVGAQCGAINLVQRFGSSLNLNVHFHVVVLDGVFSREPGGALAFHTAPPSTRDELDQVVRRVQKRAHAWLRRHGHLDERPIEARSNEAPVQTALDACASIAMARGQMARFRNEDAPENDHRGVPGTTSGAVEKDGFNLHAGVRIEAGDDAGRERLVRYAARPAFSLERLRRLPGGRVSYRLKHVGRGRGKHRVMTPMEFLARLSALIPPPRYPLVRYAGVLGPRSSWRKDVVPRPRDRSPACEGAARDAGRRAAKPSTTPKPDASASTEPRAWSGSKTRSDATAPPGALPRSGAPPKDGERPPPTDGSAAKVAPMAMLPPLVIALAPNILSVRHWDRLLGGVLYAVSPRIDWARLLRRSMGVDVLECPKCQGRVRVLAVITERQPVQRILSHLGMATEAPLLARARDPTDDVDDVEQPVQLQLGLA